MKQKKPQPQPVELKVPPLPPPPARLESARTALESLFLSKGPMSTLHFLVHPDMPELKREADARGWIARGFSRLTVPWLELHWSADGWKTKHVVSSNDVPCPIVNGTFHLTHCPPNTEVEFAIHVGLACHAQTDGAYARDVGDLWLNDGGKNYRQTTR